MIQDKDLTMNTTTQLFIHLLPPVALKHFTKEVSIPVPFLLVEKLKPRRVK